MFVEQRYAGKSNIHTSLCILFVNLTHQKRKRNFLRKEIYSNFVIVKALFLIWTLLLGPVFGDRVEFDKLVHDFGEISIKDGPVSCTFTVKNISDTPVAIFSVITTCGCTEVEWPRTRIQPGETGTISVTYDNDEGVHSFDKQITVYLSDIKRPAILHLKGVVQNKKKK